jgi:hypothetical protein
VSERLLEHQPASSWQFERRQGLAGPFGDRRGKGEVDHHASVAGIDDPPPIAFVRDVGREVARGARDALGTIAAGTGVGKRLRYPVAPALVVPVDDVAARQRDLLAAAAREQVPQAGQQKPPRQVTARA